MSNNSTNLLNLIRSASNPEIAVAKAIEITIEFLKLCVSTEAIPPACPQGHD